MSEVTVFSSFETWPCYV